MKRLLPCLSGATWAFAALLASVSVVAEETTPTPKPAVKSIRADLPVSRKVVTVYNWSDYIDPATIEQFTKETGIEVKYDVFDSNEVLQTKLLAGNTGYDVVVPSASFLELQIRAGVFQPIDRAKLPNWKYLDKDILNLVKRHDPGNRYSVNYMWGTDAIGYNVRKIKAIAPDAPVNSWRILFDPAWASKFKNCGISILDAPDEVVGVILAYLGRDPNSEDLNDLKMAEEVLMKIRPYVRTVNSSEYINGLATDELCVVMGWSGDILQAKVRAEEAGQGTEIAMNVPIDGTVIWFDMFAVPADAPHPDNAFAFINFMMTPDVAAANSNYVHYANGNAASVPLLDPEVRYDIGVYPPPETMAKLFPNLAHTQEFTRALNRTWTRFLTGK